MPSQHSKGGICSSQIPLFLLLAASLLFSFAPCRAQQPVTLPMKLVKELPYITCSIGNSGPLQCLVDTGSSLTGVAPELAARLHLQTHVDPSIPRADLAKEMLDPLILHAGDATWTTSRVSIAPADLTLLDRESGVGFHTDLVLGTSLLEQFQVTIDPDAQTVRLPLPGIPPMRTHIPF